VEFFRIEGKITGKFEKFLQSIQANSDANIQGIALDINNFSSQALRNLSTCIVAKSIPFVGFRNTINDETINTFYNFFLTGPAKDSIKFVCMDSILSLKVPTLTAKLASLTVLSVTKCNLNIGKVFPSLNSTRLRTVDFSGNNCTISLADIDIAPPPTLLHINVNEVTWGGSTLIGFFKYIDKFFTGSLKLGIARAEVQTEEWMNFFSEIRKIKFSNIRGLLWSNNPVHNNFLKYLKRNQKLHSLTVNGCFHEIDPEIIIQFSVFLVSTKSLKKLNIESNENAYLGKYTIPILTAIQATNRITFLNINNSKCGNEGATQIKHILKQNTNIETLHCDGMNPTNAHPYNEMIDIVIDMKKKRSFNFFYPSNDLNGLLRAKKIKQDQIDRIKDSLSDQGYLYHGESKLDFTNFVKRIR
jgi:hypothetical protein